MTERCDKCRFWNADSENGSDYEGVEAICRRYPPSMWTQNGEIGTYNLHEKFSQPWVLGSEWCGEFVAA